MPVSRLLLSDWKKWGSTDFHPMVNPRGFEIVLPTKRSLTTPTTSMTTPTTLMTPTSTLWQALERLLLTLRLSCYFWQKPILKDPKRDFYDNLSFFLEKKNYRLSLDDGQLNKYWVYQIWGVQDQKWKLLGLFVAKLSTIIRKLKFLLRKFGFSDHYEITMNHLSST